MTPEEKAQYEEERKQAEKRRNPYGLKFGQVSEEEIIRGAIESGVAVFFCMDLHQKVNLQELSKLIQLVKLYIFVMLHQKV